MGNYFLFWEILDKGLLLLFFRCGIFKGKITLIINFRFKKNCLRNKSKVILVWKISTTFNLFAFFSSKNLRRT